MQNTANLKKAVAFVTVIVMICAVFAGVAVYNSKTDDAYAAEETVIVLHIGDAVMTVNGEGREIDPGRGTVPMIAGGRTLVPIRAVIEAAGGSAAWDDAAQQVTLTHGGTVIRLVIDSYTAYINDAEATLDVAPTTINDRTMLPVRFVAENLGFNVAWDETTETVTISSLDQQTAEPAVTEPSDNTGSRMLVVYFSATGNTEAVAETIAEVTGADVYEIIPEQPYTDDDLNYNDDSCRANREMNDESARPAISGGVENIEQYDTIFLGYPIWWGTMPRIINTFLDTYDLSGKTIMPFCTSGSSGISSSVSDIRSICPNSDVKDGLRGTSSTDAEQITEWLTESGV